MSKDPALATRPRWAELDLTALRANYRELHRRAGVDVIASIKANAYGHGAVAVARALESEGVAALATGSFEDALAVRAAGVRTPILLFGAPLPAALPEVVRHGLIPTVHDLLGAEALSLGAHDTTPVWIEVDAGLGRLGVGLDEAEAFVRTVAAMPHLQVGGLYTHTPFQDEDGEAWATAQVRAFGELVVRLERAGIAFPVTQALSSAGVLAGLRGPFTAVCPGHALYGLAPARPEIADLSAFAPVLHAVKARLIQIARRETARTIGIGGMSSLPAGSTTAVVPFGRYDGYRAPRDGEAQMLVQGRRCPVLGVSLEHVMLDVSSCEGPAVGDEVVVIGSQGDEEITLDEVAAWQGASPTDVILTLERRLPYLYMGA